VTTIATPQLQLPRGFEFSDETARMDRARIHRWLSTESYWAAGRQRTIQDAAIDASRNFGIFRIETREQTGQQTGEQTKKQAGEQVAYARIVTDGVTFAWLCDVFVDSSMRGLGIGVALIDGVCAALEPRHLKRIMLATADAHGLYRKFGFEPLAAPDKWMAKETRPN